jgi:diguanylate cyclase (GGDEF)-like protein/PAS domain S-box-containing protein
LVVHLSETIFLVEPSGEASLRLGPSVGPLGFGLDEEDGGPVHVAERVHPDDLVAVLGLIEQVRSTPGMRTAVRVRARHKDGSWRIVEAVIASATDDPHLGGALLRIRDVTAPDAAGELGDRFRSLAEAVPSGILCADATGVVVFCNEAARQVLGLPEGRLLGRGWEAAVDPADRLEVIAAAQAVLVSRATEEVSFRVRGASGQRWAHARFVPLDADTANLERAPAGWLAALDDVTDRRRLESQLAHRATHDPLTELPNRALLEDRLAQACARLGRDDEPLAVLFCDLDDFKDVNDRFDHAVGDRVLVEVGRRLRQVLRPADTVCRFGGDEFVVVCERTDPTEAEEVAERIRAVLAAPFAEAGDSGLGVSIGLAVARGADVDPHDLLLRADQAMYRIKQAGSAGRVGDDGAARD